MTKSKDSLKKKRKKKEQRKEVFEKKKAYQTSCRILETFYKKISPPATFDSNSLIARYVLSRQAKDENSDPLKLSGVEHYLMSYPDEESKRNWTHEAQVSLISIGEYLGSFSSDCRGVFHRYEGLIVQDLDSGTTYGKLLARQKHQGDFEKDNRYGDVFERVVHLVVHVDKPNSKESAVFKQNGGLVPKLIVLDPVKPLRITCENSELDLDRQFIENCMVEDLSDPEVDRLFELTIEISKWLIDVKFTLELRDREKKKLSLALHEMENEETESNLRYTTLLEKYEAFEGKIKDLEKSLQESEERLELRRANSEIELSQLAWQKESIEDELKSLKSLRINLLSRVRDEGSRVEFEEKLKQLNKKEKILPSRIAELSKELDEAREEHKRQINEMEVKIGKIKEDLGKYQQQFQFIHEEVEMLKAELNLVKQKKATAECKLSYL